MAKISLKQLNDVYKGIKIKRVNEGRYYKRPNVNVHYSLNINDVDIYFATQEDVIKYIDNMKP